MTKYLMEVHSGYVQTEEEWLDEMPQWETTRDGLTPEEQFKELIEVVKDADGTWIDA